MLLISTLLVGVPLIEVLPENCYDYCFLFFNSMLADMVQRLVMVGKLPDIVAKYHFVITLFFSGCSSVRTAA